MTSHDETDFTELVERYRAELRVHCYRMLGSYDESEDLVQETFLRAWRGRESRRDPRSVRAWLYRIATNACLDVLKRHRRRPRRSDGEDAGPPPLAVPWLQPYPDHLLEQIPAGDAEPYAAVVKKETIELAFLAAVQLLPPRQRAALVLRDVQGWSARETAEALEVSVASVNSALQRARATLREHLPYRRTDWSRAADPSEDERAVLQRYMDAVERADDAALAIVLSQDVLVGHQAGAGGLAPEPTWYQGRDTVIAAWAPILHTPDAPEIKMMPTRANRQPAVATYVREPGGSEFRAFALAVLRIEDGAVAELTVFVPDVFPAFGLHATV